MIWRRLVVEAVLALELGDDRRPSARECRRLGVFRVLPLSIALIAASLMLSGVSKSGSPAPRPMTSRPAAFSSRALSVTAMVGGRLDAVELSARKAMETSTPEPKGAGMS